MIDGKYEYFAFISYKEEDAEWAKWLQHELENHKLPTAIRKDHPELPEYIRPIYEYKSEAGGGGLENELLKGLTSSKYLIVICSPRSGGNKSQWVNNGIHYFIESGLEENIIPFIVNGKPKSDNPDEECFPSALLELKGKRERRGININEMGRDAAAVKVISAMFDVKFDSLWQRHEREKEEERRRLKEQNDKKLIVQSRYMAEKAMKLIDEGDSYLARRLAIEVLPKNLEKLDRPQTIEAEILLRKSLYKDNAILKGHTHSAIASVFSKDCSRIFSIATDGYLCVWDAINGMLLHKKLINDGYGTALCLSPDGNTLATAVGNKVFLLDTDTYNPQENTLNHNTYISQVMYSQDGELIFTALSNGYIKIWNKKGECVSEFKDNDNADFKGIEWMNINKENRIFACTRESLNMWDYVNGKINYTGQISLPIGRSYAMKFSPDGKYMVNSHNGDVYIWDTHSYSPQTQTYNLLVEKPLQHKGDVLAIDISPDSKHIAVGADNCLYIWTCDFRYNYYLSDWENSELLEFDALIDYICYHKEKNILIVSFNNSDVKIIDFNKKCCDVLPIAANSLDFSPDGNSFAVVSKENYAPIIYNAKNYKRVFQSKEIVESVFKELESENKVVVFHEKGDVLLTLSDSINKWNVKNVAYVKMPHNRIGDYSCCSRTISRNGKLAIFSFKHGKTLIIDVDDNSIINQLAIDMTRTHYPYPVASFSYDSKYIATTSKNGDAKIWDAFTRELLCVLPPVPTVYWGNSIEFSKDGTLIISANQNKNAIIWKWDAKTNHAVFFSLLEGHNERVTHASFSNDGRLAVTASLNKIIVWDVSTSSIMKVIKHSEEKKFVCFSPDNTRIISSNGESMFIWDYPSLQELIKDTHTRFEKRVLTLEEKKKYYLA